jgi:acetyl-CoA/propionyl-CoA carboxylase, biotin carboxylase, biotin carboxyl carrier protein
MKGLVFGKVVVANRGEIAVRVIRTLRSLGIVSVAVYSDADESAAHVRDADEALRIGAAPASESYLNIERIVAAAVDAGAEAVHPGYGFLAENARFARACLDAGLVFVGPPPSAIEAMGDKIAAKAVVSAAGVPVVPGAGEAGMTDDALLAAVDPGWFPVLIKPSAGGGGKGMRVVSSPAEMPAALESARRTAVAAFGDGTLLVERYVPTPRHIEIQVLADGHGGVVHLGERECSLQRRHQKIIEEAPSPLLTAAQRSAMGDAAVSAARSVGYVGAGTVEFIVAGEAPDDFFFMEMNTRLQVEHPVTELVYGLDLVEWQLRVAAGEPLPAPGADAAGWVMRGHAVEARVYAEDPARGFLPTGGTVLGLRTPGGAGVRVDSGLAPGVTVTSDYDPMLAKVAAWGPDRATALRRVDAALADTVVLGVATNVAFLRGLVRDPDVQAGRLDTGLVERIVDRGADPAVGPVGLAGVEAAPAGTHVEAAGSHVEAAGSHVEAAGSHREMSGAGAPDISRNFMNPARDVLAAAALARMLAREPAGPVTDPWDIPDGWRPGERAWTKFRLSVAGEAVEVRVRGLASAGAEVAVGDGEPVAARASFQPARRAVGDGAAVGGVTTWSAPDGAGAGGLAGNGAAGADLVLTYEGRTVRFAYADQGAVTWLARDGAAWAISEAPPVALRGARAGSADGSVRSPMPGTILAVHVALGDVVSAGQPVLVVEAMKMEHTVTAPVDGTVTELTAKVGQQVGMDEPLAVIEAPGVQGA